MPEPDSGSLPPRVRPRAEPGRSAPRGATLPPDDEVLIDDLTEDQDRIFLDAMLNA